MYFYIFIFLNLYIYTVCVLFLWCILQQQQRLFLEQCWHCVEYSGLSAESLSGTNCGVFVGAGVSDYQQSIKESSAQTLLGGSTSILASRISYFLNLKGPSVAIDTACSSSLVALVNACDSLANKSTDMALAGGVCVSIQVSSSPVS